MDPRKRNIYWMYARSRQSVASYPIGASWTWYCISDNYEKRTLSRTDHCTWYLSNSQRPSTPYGDRAIANTAEIRMPSEIQDYDHASSTRGNDGECCIGDGVCIYCQYRALISSTRRPRLFQYLYESLKINMKKTEVQYQLSTKTQEDDFTDHWLIETRWTHYIYIYQAQI